MYNTVQLIVFSDVTVTFKHSWHTYSYLVDYLANLLLYKAAIITFFQYC